jgi:hypothetical protein
MEFDGEKKEDKYEIFKDTRITEEIFYGDSVFSTFGEENTTKSYFKKLYSLDIPLKVKRKVEEKIISLKKRIHSISDEILCSIVILSYQEVDDKEIIFDILKIYKIFGIDPSKSKISQYTSNATTKTTLVSDSSIFINVLVPNPSIYINQIFDEYIKKNNLIFENLKELTDKIIKFSNLIFDTNAYIKQCSPYETAAVMIFLYLKEINTKKSFFKKSSFLLLEGINKKKFEKGLKEVDNALIFLKNHHGDSLLSCY